MKINKERKLILIFGSILLLVGLVYRSSSIFDVLLDTSEFELKKKKLITYQQHLPDREILEKKKQVLRKRVEEYENFLLKGDTPALAAVSIQNRIGQIAEATGLEIKSTTVQKPTTIENTDLVSVDVQFTTELSIGQLKQLLYQIEISDRPLLQMKDMQLRRTSGSQAAVRLQTVMTVRGFMAKIDSAG